MDSGKLIVDSCDFLYSMLPSLLSGFIISVITAWITVQLALDRFRTEKWWTKKAESYSAIIESLHHMKEYCLTEIRAIENGQEISEQLRNELLSKFNKGIQEVSLATDIGSFIISNDAEILLKELQKKYDQIDFGNNVYNYYDQQAAIFDNCLNSLKEIARADLKIK